MSYISKDLNVLAYANNFTLWHYTTSDSDITEKDYFKSALGMLRVNDLIVAQTTGDLGVQTTKFYIVTECGSDTVQVSPMM